MGPGSLQRTPCPAAAAVEEAAACWLKELLGIPDTASVGFVTGGQATNTVGLAAARHEVLARQGWDVETKVLLGAPRVGSSPAPSGMGLSTGPSGSSASGRGWSRVATWAAIRQLGRSGVADLVERCCSLARRFADELVARGAEIANEVVLNRVLVGFGDDARTDRVIEGVQRDGTCWIGGTTWHGRRLMRISVSNWSTTEADVDRSVAAIRRSAADA